MEDPRYHIMVPAYHEEGIVYHEIKVLQDLLEEESVDYRITLVDDGSDDGTFQEAKNLEKNSMKISSLTYQENHGKGYALRKGLEDIDTNPDYIIFFDADGDIRPESLIQMINITEKGDKDILTASKWHKDSEVDYPLLRTALSKILSIYTRFYLGLKVKDTQTGLKALRYPVVEDLRDHTFIDGYAFDIELLYLARKEGYSVEETPVKLIFGGNSSLDIIDIVNIFFDVLKLRMRPT